MTRTNVKIIMIQKGFTISSLARKWEVTPQTIYDVLAERMSSHRIQTALEEAFGLPIEQIRKAWNTQGKPVMTPEIKSALDSFSAAANM